MIFCLLLNLTTTTGYASPLQNGHNNYGYPLIIINESAGICKQNGLPIGFSLYYDYATEEYSCISGFSETFTNAAYALAYSAGNYNKITHLMSAVSFPYKTLTFGAAFRFLFSGDEPSFSADGGIRLYFQEKKYVAINLRNLVCSDTLNGITNRSISLLSGGDVSWIDECYYSVNSSVYVYNLFHFKYWTYSYAYDGGLHIEKFFFNNPSVSLSSLGTIVYTKYKNLEWRLDNALGIHFAFKRFSLGSYIGFEQFSVPSRYRLSFSLYINPLFRKEIPKLTCDIDCENWFFTPNGDGENENGQIYILGSFSNKKVQTKRWTLFISKRDSSNNEMIKLFSGGNIPPSTVLWNGRNAKNELVEEGVYDIQLIIIDSMNRMVRSPRKKIEVK